MHLELPYEEGGLQFVRDALLEFRIDGILGQEPRLGVPTDGAYSLNYIASLTFGTRQLASWCKAQRVGGRSAVSGSVLRGLGARKDLRPAAIASSSERAPLLCIASSSTDRRSTRTSGRRVTRQVKV